MNALQRAAISAFLDALADPARSSFRVSIQHDDDSHDVYSFGMEHDPFGTNPSEFHAYMSFPADCSQEARNRLCAQLKIAVDARQWAIVPEDEKPTDDETQKFMEARFPESKVSSDDLACTAFWEVDNETMTVRTGVAP